METHGTAMTFDIRAPFTQLRAWELATERTHSHAWEKKKQCKFVMTYCFCVSLVHFGLTFSLQAQTKD